MMKAVSQGRASSATNLRAKVMKLHSEKDRYDLSSFVRIFLIQAIESFSASGFKARRFSAAALIRESSDQGERAKGMSSGRRREDSARAQARAMVFSSSRTLPFQ